MCVALFMTIIFLLPGSVRIMKFSFPLNNCDSVFKSDPVTVTHLIYDRDIPSDEISCSLN